MNNEKRLQQIRDAARYKYPDERIHFIDGAKWADSHPAVEDELPKERGKLYLVCDKYGRVGESAYDVEDDMWYRQSGMVLNPTHWMPLPTPPVKKGGAL